MDHVWCQVSRREICEGQSIKKTGYSPSTSVSPVIIFPSMLHTHLHLHVALTRRTNGRSLGTFQKAKLFRKSRLIGRRAPPLKGTEWGRIDWIDRIRTGQMAGYCQHGTECSGSIKYGQFLQQLRKNDLTKKGSHVCSKSQKVTKFSNRTMQLGRTSPIWAETARFPGLKLPGMRIWSAFIEFRGSEYVQPSCTSKNIHGYTVSGFIKHEDNCMFVSTKYPTLYTQPGR
jgi:hypothetical protein